jgi:hypothetical protein
MSDSDSDATINSRLLEELSDEEGWDLKETENFVVEKVKATKMLMKELVEIVKSNALVLHAIHSSAKKFFMDKDFIA